MKIYQLTLQVYKMRTQNKENYYYMFWVVAMVAFIVPQVFTAIAYHKLANNHGRLHLYQKHPIFHGLEVQSLKNQLSGALEKLVP